MVALVIGMGTLYIQNQNAKQGIFNEYVISQQGIRNLLEIGVQQFEIGNQNELTRNLALINLHYAGIYKIIGGSVGEFAKFPQIIKYFDSQARDLIQGKYNVAIVTGLEQQDLEELRELHARLNAYTELLSYDVIKGKSPSQIRKKMIEIAEQLEFEKQ